MKYSHRFKKHHSYTIIEAARRLGVHKRTVQRWLTIGLRCCSECRPILILGCDLNDFLGQQQLKKRQLYCEGQLYCVSCRMPKDPAGKMVDIIQMSTSAGLLRAICPDCGRLMHRGIGLANLEALTKTLEVVPARAKRRLEDRSPALVDVTFGRAA
jgi:hypothetical protein